MGKNNETYEKGKELKRTKDKIKKTKYKKETQEEGMRDNETYGEETKNKLQYMDETQREEMKENETQVKRKREKFYYTDETQAEETRVNETQENAEREFMKSIDKLKHIDETQSCRKKEHKTQGNENGIHRDCYETNPCFITNQSILKYIKETEIEGDKQGDIKEFGEEHNLEYRIDLKDGVHNLEGGTENLKDRISSDEERRGRFLGNWRGRVRSTMDLVNGFVVKGVENICGWWGQHVANSPIRFILATLFIAAICSLGLLNVQHEERSYKLWYPEDSQFTKVHSFEMENFERHHRNHLIVWKAADDNLLTAKAIRSMWQFRQKILNISIPFQDTQVTWYNVCATLPSLPHISDVSSVLDNPFDSHSPLEEGGRMKVMAGNETAKKLETQNGTRENLEEGEIMKELVGNGTAEKLKKENGTRENLVENKGILETGENLVENKSRPILGTRENLVEDKGILETGENLVENKSRSILGTGENLVEDKGILETGENLVEDKSKVIRDWAKRAEKIMKEKFCPVYETQPKLCYERSLLEVWSYNQSIIMNLTDEKVVNDINMIQMSPVFGIPTNFINFLGGVEMDSQGRVVKAKAALHKWVTNLEHIDEDELDLSNGDVVGKAALAWEEELVKETLNTQSPELMPIPNAAHSLWKESESAMWWDTAWVFAGWFALIIYVLVTLGRPGPALVGIFCVGVAVVTSFGICSALAIPFVTLNSLLSILLLGLGVDDMYVIVAVWDSNNSDAMTVDQLGKNALKKAGVAIIFTSLTDFLAFLVGSSTSIPGLRWFCICATIGIATIFLLQATIFLAALAIDQRRRNASPYVTPSCHRMLKAKWKRAIEHYANFLVRPLTSIIIVILGTILAGVGLWLATGLRLEYQINWIVPKSSYLHGWFDVMEKYFPKTGESGVIYFSNVSFPNDLPELHKLVNEINVSPYIKSVDAWFSRMEETWHLGSALSWPMIQNITSIFFHTPVGARYSTHFAFKRPIHCGHPIPPFSAFSMRFQYKMLESWEDQEAAMEEVRRTVASANISGFRIVWAHAFIQWETHRGLAQELWQNLGIIVGVVGGVTALMVGIRLAALLVVVCVAATLIEVAAIMNIWGLTIDMFTIIALVLSGGLCVDYTAHVAHAFLAARGQRRTRAEYAINKVGPPILHAGFSTLLAFLALAPTASHLFQAFFKIFTACSIVGLLQGLVVLPALLALLG